MAFLENQEEALLDATDRLVYKLVRVEEDGTIVPASEDEVVKVESLMEGSSPVHATDVLETESYHGHNYSLNGLGNSVSQQKSSFDIPESKCLGSLEEDKRRLVAQLAFLDAFIHKLDEEEMKNVSEDCHKQGQLSNCKCESNFHANINLDEVCRELESPSSSNMGSLPSYSHGNFLQENPGHSTSIMKHTGLDLLKGNVSLDKLSIGGLHEAFRTTLRQHGVTKDDLWLKGRITVSLADAHETRDSEIGNADSMIVSLETMCDSARAPMSSPAETIGIGTTQIGTNRLPDTGFSLEGGSDSIVTKKGYKRKSSESVVLGELPERKRSNKNSTATDDRNRNSMLVDADGMFGSASSPTSPIAGTTAVKTIETGTNRLLDAELSLKAGSKTTVKRKGYKRNLSKSAASHKFSKHKKTNQASTDSNNGNGTSELIHAEKRSASVRTSKSSAARTRNGTNTLPDKVLSLKVDPKLALPRKGTKRSSESVESVVSHEHPEHKKNSQVVTSEYSGNMGKFDEMMSSENEGKRKRKPTKRYIEELAVCDIRDMTCTGLVSSALKDANEEINGTNILVEDEGVESAVDNIEIPEIKLQYSYRRHRRPKQEQGGKKRKMNTNSSGRAAQLVRKAISGRAARLNIKSTYTKIKVKPPVPNRTDVTSVSLSPLQQDAETVETAPKASEKISSENRVLVVKNPKSRKPDHPWSAKEVLKLLEGITRCGVGRWSEIKKLWFPNAANRSSADIKAKWRNLVRASNRHYKLNLQRGEHRRKHLGSHIPGDILVQVHELFTVFRRGQRSNNGQKNRRKASKR